RRRFRCSHDPATAISLNSPSVVSTEGRRPERRDLARLRQGLFNIEPWHGDQSSTSLQARMVAHCISALRRTWVVGLKSIDVVYRSIRRSTTSRGWSTSNRSRRLLKPLSERNSSRDGDAKRRSH